MTKPRKGQFGAMLTHQECRLRFHGSFERPEFDTVKDVLSQVEEVAWLER